jgi:hypothetical protein
VARLGKPPLRPSLLLPVCVFAVASAFVCVFRFQSSVLTFVSLHFRGSKVAFV